MPAAPASQAPALRPLAVCIDDLGLHAGVNRAARALAQQGRVSSWSCLVDGPAMAEVVRGLGEVSHDTLECGLHLNLTEALPGARWVRPLNTLIVDAYRGALAASGAAAALAVEIARQLDLFETIVGRRPDFIDGHQHVHQLPGVRDALLSEIARRWPGPAARPWLRRCARPAPAPQGMPGLPWPERIKPWIIQTLGCEALSRGARRLDLEQSAHLLGVRRFDSDEAGFQSLLDAWVARATERDVLMVHPAVAAEGVNDALLPAREAEARVLAGDAFAATLARHGVRVQALAATLRGPAAALR